MWKCRKRKAFQGYLQLPGWERVRGELGWARQPSTVPLERAGCCGCPVSAACQRALRFPGGTAVLSKLPLMALAVGNLSKSACCRSCSTCCFAAVARLELCACVWNVSCWGTKQTAFGGVVPRLCGESLRCWGGGLEECVCIFFYFFFLAVSWKTRVPACVSRVCCITTCLSAAGNLLQEDLHHMQNLWLQLRGVLILCTVMLFVSLGVRIITAVPRAPDFFPLSLNWLKQPNMHSFLQHWEIVWKNQHVLRSVSPK